MRKIITTMWVTLDGFIAGPNEEMDWVGEIYDEAMGKEETAFPFRPLRNTGDFTCFEETIRTI